MVGGMNPQAVDGNGKTGLAANQTPLKKTFEQYVTTPSKNSQQIFSTPQQQQLFHQVNMMQERPK